MAVEIRRLGPEDEDAVLAAAELFDAPPRRDATRRFLASPGHHLLVAFDGSRAVGFASAVELTHPDKGTELFLYELSVAEDARRRGVGRGLVEALRALAQDRGCYGMWVLTEDDNAAALATYRRAGSVEEERPVLLNWRLGDEGR